jgi:hypothetical protein
MAVDSPSGTNEALATIVSAKDASLSAGEFSLEWEKFEGTYENVCDKVCAKMENIKDLQHFVATSFCQRALDANDEKVTLCATWKEIKHFAVEMCFTPELSLVSKQVLPLTELPEGSFALMF